MWHWEIRIATVKVWHTGKGRNSCHWRQFLTQCYSFRALGIVSYAKSMAFYKHEALSCMLNSDVPLGWAVPRGYVCSISIPWGEQAMFFLLKFVDVNNKGITFLFLKFSTFSVLIMLCFRKYISMIYHLPNFWMNIKSNCQCHSRFHDSHCSLHWSR